jgi:transposase
MVAIDGQGIPLTGILSSASTSEYNLLFPTLETIAIAKRPLHPITKPKKLIADRGYDAKWVREKLRAKGITPYIPKRRKKGQTEEPSYNQKIKPFYKIRFIVERSIAWVGSCRRVATRYERYAHIYKAFFQLACIMLCLNWVLK